MQKWASKEIEYLDKKGKKGKKGSGASGSGGAPKTKMSKDHAMYVHNFVDEYMSLNLEWLEFLNQ